MYGVFHVCYAGNCKELIDAFDVCIAFSGPVMRICEPDAYVYVLVSSDNLDRDMADINKRITANRSAWNFGS